VLSLARQKGLPVVDKAHYYIERNDPISRAHRDPISRCRIALFAFMSRNSAHAINRFRIPSNNLIEIGRIVEL
jgi:KUP system potassium uptake protein